MIHFFCDGMRASVGAVVREPAIALRSRTNPRQLHIHVASENIFFKFFCISPRSASKLICRGRDWYSLGNTIAGVRSRVPEQQLQMISVNNARTAREMDTPPAPRRTPLSFTSIDFYS